MLSKIHQTLAEVWAAASRRGYFTGHRPWRSAVQTIVVGGLAAVTAFGLVRWIS